MTKKYFKIENQALLTAIEEETEARKAMMESIKPLAERFGGRPLWATDGGSYYFAGLSFANGKPENPELWTKPDEHGRRHLRASLRKGSTEQRQALRQLKEEWKDLMPENTQVKRDPVYQAMGTHWGQVLFSGIEFFELDGAVYVATGASLQAEGLSEILGSDFDAAKSELKTRELESQEK